MLLIVSLFCLICLCDFSQRGCHTPTLKTSHERLNPNGTGELASVNLDQKASCDCLHLDGTAVLASRSDLSDTCTCLSPVDRATILAMRRLHYTRVRMAPRRRSRRHECNRHRSTHIRTCNSTHNSARTRSSCAERPTTVGLLVPPVRARGRAE